MMHQGQPRLEIYEEPKRNSLRFRYATEGEKAGSISGENSTIHHQTFPSVQLFNCEGMNAVVVASCVTADNPPYLPHPHRLVGHECEKGVCKINVRSQDNKIIPLTRIGIQCCKSKKEYVQESLHERDILASSQFIVGTGFESVVAPDNYNFTTVRLCFQLFVYGNDNRLSLADKKFSQPIVDKSTHK
jgi:hypothetical protein